MWRRRCGKCKGCLGKAQLEKAGNDPVTDPVTDPVSDPVREWNESSRMYACDRWKEYDNR